MLYKVSICPWPQIWSQLPRCYVLTKKKGWKVLSQILRVIVDGHSIHFDKRLFMQWSISVYSERSQMVRKMLFFLKYKIYLRVHWMYTFIIFHLTLTHTGHQCFGYYHIPVCCLGSKPSSDISWIHLHWTVKLKKVFQSYLLWKILFSSAYERISFLIVTTLIHS